MSSPYPHLSRAPITEALLDIRAELPPDSTLQALESFSSRLGGAFPDVRPIQHLEAHLAMDGGLTSRSPLALGNIHWNADRSRAVQARLDGFTVNHVKSYASWEDMRDQARSLWEHYREVARPIKVVRCALRYLNRLQISAGVELGLQLRTRPEISPGLPQALDEYFMRVGVPFEGGRKAVITEATDRAADASESLDLILDIEAFAVRELDPGSEDLWSELERLREIKNECFFSSLEKGVWEAYR